MTDLVDRLSPQPAQSRGAPASPAATRLATPRWRDGRLVAGVLLMLLATLLGARAFALAGRTTTVLVAGRALPAGHLLAPGDLRVQRLRLSGVGGHYWPATELPGLAGHPLLTAVGPGDLLPRSAVAPGPDPRPSRVVSLPVDPARLPALAPGDRVDVFATYKPGGELPGQTVAVLRGADYLGGGDAGSGTTVSIRLRVAVDQAAALIRASQVAALDVVLQQPAGDQAGDVGGAPIGDPAARPGAPASGPPTTAGPGGGAGTSPPARP